MIRLFHFMLIAGGLIFAAVTLKAASDMPLNIFNVPFWQEFFVVRRANADQLKLPIQALYLELRDMDDFNECAIYINGLGPLNPPVDCLSDADNMPGMIILPPNWLKEGDNKISFYRTGDCNGTSKGFAVHQAELLFAADRSELNAMFDRRKANLPLPADLMNYSRPLAIRYDFVDNFSSNKPGKEFAYWMNMSGDWQVVSENGNSYMTTVNAEPNARLFLHVYGQDSVFSGRFRVHPDEKKSAFYFLGRCSAYPDWMVRAGYNYELGTWQISESFHSKKTYDFGAPPPSPDVWHDFEMVFSGREVKLIIDGKEIARVNQLLNTNYGRVGFVADQLKFDLDDIKLRCEAIPMDGVKEWVLGAQRRGYAGDLNIVRAADGRLLMHYHGGDGNNSNKVCRESLDEGKSWSQPIPDPFQGVFGVIGIEGLQDGRYIAMRYAWKDNNSPADIYARVSDVGGKQWGKEFNLSNGGINVAMNGKITQISNGRIFIPACKAAGFEGEKTGGVVVHYSDDAIHWQRGKHDLDHSTTNMNLQEAQIVELTGGKLMMIMRCEEPYLVASYSNDNGESWTNPLPLPLPSVMCAFGVRRAPDTGEIYIFWTFDDTTQVPKIHQFPRERISLAVSRDDGWTWQFLGDIDAFGGHQGRFMNLGLFIEKQNIFLTATVFNFDQDKRVVIKLWRIERNKLKPYAVFPPLH